MWMSCIKFTSRLHKIIRLKWYLHACHRLLSNALLGFAVAGLGRESKRYSSTVIVPTKWSFNKKREQERRSKIRQVGQAKLRRHSFEEEYKFSWTDITSHQIEKAIFASFYFEFQHYPWNWSVMYKSSLTVSIIRRVLRAAYTIFSAVIFWPYKTQQLEFTILS